ncbi:DUF6781 family protein [uncultured Piscinibacter sp.]|uniref:DUF6781 family protein n=1 Tax=uncultured Piscinibacter sp. TaxID=1131835 RepID=UPI0026170733|nr:DUF6781 family protein [uncultured Piscinibacter sp.]
MQKSGIDQDALIQMFANASSGATDQVRKGVTQATLAALQGRELSLKNIRSVLKTVAQAASAGAAQNKMPDIDVEDLLDKAVVGMDEALLKAVEANRVALQQFVNQGADLREKNLKKALTDLEAMEDSFIGAVKKAAESAGTQAASQWAPVLEKMQAGGTLSGAKAATTAEQFVQQMQTAMRDSRAASLKAAQTLAESYAALVSGVLIGMSDALAQGGTAKPRGRK